MEAGSSPVGLTPGCLEAGDPAGAGEDLTRALEIVPRNSPHHGEILKLLRQIGTSLEPDN